MRSFAVRMLCMPSVLLAICLLSATATAQDWEALADAAYDKVTGDRDAIIVRLADVVASCEEMEEDAEGVDGYGDVLDLLIEAYTDVHEFNLHYTCKDAFLDAKEEAIEALTEMILEYDSALTDVELAEYLISIGNGWIAGGDFDYGIGEYEYAYYQYLIAQAYIKDDSEDCASWDCFGAEVHESLARDAEIETVDALSDMYTELTECEEPTARQEAIDIRFHAAGHGVACTYQQAYNVTAIGVTATAVGTMEGHHENAESRYTTFHSQQCECYLTSGPHLCAMFSYLSGVIAETTGEWDQLVVAHAAAGSTVTGGDSAIGVGDLHYDNAVLPNDYVQAKTAFSSALTYYHFAQSTKFPAFETHNNTIMEEDTGYIDLWNEDYQNMIGIMNECPAD